MIRHDGDVGVGIVGVGGAAGRCEEGRLGDWLRAWVATDTMAPMPVGKKPLPLLDLMSEANARRETPPVLIPTAPAPTRGTGPDFRPLEPKPLPVEPVLTRPSGNADLPKHVLPGLGGKPMVLGTNVLLVAAGVVIGLFVLVWVAGNANGSRNARQDFQRDFGQVSQTGSQQGVVQDPLNTPVVPAVSADPKVHKAALPAQVPTAGAGKVPVGQVAAADPRQAGWNYLLLGTLAAEDASAAMQYFAKNGVDTFAVPAPLVDRRGVRANTSPLFQLFVSKGVASSEFGARQAERDKLKQEVVRLGAAWKKDHKGTMSFSDAFWLKND